MFRSRLKRERFFFTTGCVALGAAMLAVTFVPFIVNNYMAETFISMNQYKNYAVTFYAITILCFFFSPRYEKMQLKWIGITLVYFLAFQILAKIVT